ncbi:enoyl-CoA hydratase/isomerase family protein [Parahaliea maris]|uniref:Enoyl-CoA hydratase/isomerase family protein n=1 Tax=Parahaliea maris TaxID=2716870 RepID=A0A5C8ZYH0_9GAMM|nr:enoyl-CoA hydratase/isomerase family protein [Parahaliea maris]TXS92774.1 enoyl-CoA hydratase/isomerase family protein [Parahaliea maris]
MSNDVLVLENRGPVTWLILNRPMAMNALDSGIISLFEQYLPIIAADDCCSVLVITGSGRAFCAGMDLKQVVEANAVAAGEMDILDRLCENVLDPLRDFPKPVIAALNGITLAGGLEMAMCADLVVAAESARIGDAHANFGVYPGAGGAAILPRLVPLNIAKYLLLTGRTLSAEQMQHYGFVNEVVSSDSLQTETQKLAEHIAGNSPLAMRRMKSVANRASDGSRSASLQREQVAMRKHLRSWDFEEGIAAFTQKRKPRFRGY